MAARHDAHAFLRCARNPSVTAGHVHWLVRTPAMWDAFPMRCGWSVVGLVSLACIGCGGGSLSPGPAGPALAGTGFEGGAPPKGAPHHITQTPFAVGATPVLH